VIICSVGESRDLTKSRHRDSLKKSQLTLCQGMLKKGDDVAFEGDDTVLRTSVTIPCDSDTVY
jgi:hypothetical protein